MTKRLLRLVPMMITVAVAIQSAASPIQPDSLALQEQACPPICTWEGVFNYTYDDVSSGRSPWHDLRGSVFYSRGSEAVGLEVIQASRFDRWDQAVAIDSYAGLWEGSYGNLRVQYAPSPAFLAELEAYGEVYQAIPDAWEVSANYRLRSYPGDQIHLIGLSVGRYIGAWMVRGLGRVLPRAGELGAVYAVEARRYFEPPRSFLELEAGIGRGVEVVAAGPVIQTTETFYVMARLQRYVTSHLGVAVHGAYSDDDFFTRRTGGAGLMVRW